MFRNIRKPVRVRDAVPTDAAALLAIWADLSKRAPDEPVVTPEADASTAIARIAAEPDERLLVGIVEDRVVSTIHLRRAPVSPIHTETAIHASHLQVLEGWRHRGVGRALLEAAVAWAEEKDTGHILAASAISSREANRFMARLGLAQIAVVRGATVPALRARLSGESVAVVGGPPHQNLAHVLARRRSLRRTQSKPQSE